MKQTLTLILSVVAVLFSAAAIVIAYRVTCGAQGSPAGPSQTAAASSFETYVRGMDDRLNTMKFELVRLQADVDSMKQWDRLNRITEEATRGFDQSLKQRPPAAADEPSDPR